MNSSADPSSTDKARADLLAAGNIPMPRLSDDAVVQIHDFLHHVLETAPTPESVHPSEARL